MIKALNIISFDVPFPANYGGVIDVFYKIKTLKLLNIDIYLHCFEYGRGEAPELEKYCKQIFYYKRNTSIHNHLGIVPYIVKSRQAPDLLNNLLQNNFPILFEGLHTCFLLNHPKLKNRIKVFRESNIEHEYYAHLANAEKSLAKKLYFSWEARKLKKFEPIIQFATLSLTVSQEDTGYFKQNYPKNKVVYLPSFHSNTNVHVLTGKGDYILYHGNLSVAENELAAIFLIENVFSNIQNKVIIAGLNPNIALKNLVQKYTNIQLIENPTETEMEKLIANAQIHCLYTHQATGLKLKLLNVLYSGRFCICNENMVHGTGLETLCILANESGEIIKNIQYYFSQNYTTDISDLRINILNKNYDNSSKAQKLMDLINNAVS